MAIPGPASRFALSVLTHTVLMPLSESYIIPEILYEDEYFVVVNKPMGILSQEDPTGHKPIGQYVRQYLHQQSGTPLADLFVSPINRLDRPVGGIMMLAKSKEAEFKMSALFKHRLIRKRYWAITSRIPRPKQAYLKHFLRKDTSENKVTLYQSPQLNTKPTALRYSYLRSANNFHLIEVLLLTGQPHQIRAQLASVKSPIVGDRKYGSPRPNHTRNICLFAHNIAFIHPYRFVPVKIEAQPPDDPIWNLFFDAR